MVKIQNMLMVLYWIETGCSVLQGALWETCNGYRSSLLLCFSSVFQGTQQCYLRLLLYLWWSLLVHSILGQKLKNMGHEDKRILVSWTCFLEPRTWGFC